MGQEVNFNSEAIKLVIGTGSRLVSFDEFTELFKVLRHERLTGFFKANDRRNAGFIEPAAAWPLVASLGGYTQASPLFDNFKQHFEKVSFADLVAISSIFSKLDLIRAVVFKASEKSTLLDRTLFASTSAQLHQLDSSMSPLEVDVLFKLVGPNATTLSFSPLFDPYFIPPSKTIVQLSGVMETAKIVYNFGLGSIAGACGAFAVYPIGNL